MLIRLYDVLFMRIEKDWILVMFSFIRVLTWLVVFVYGIELCIRVSSEWCLGFCGEGIEGRAVFVNPSATVAALYGVSSYYFVADFVGICLGAWVCFDIPGLK